MTKIFSGKRSALTVIGLIAIVIGYVLLGEGSMSLAPILLVLGYCVFIPVALL